MNIKDTKLFFLEEDCINQFGADKGKEIFQSAAMRYEELCSQANVWENAEIEYHLTMNLFLHWLIIRHCKGMDYQKKKPFPSFVRKRSAQRISREKNRQKQQSCLSLI